MKWIDEAVTKALDAGVDLHTFEALIGQAYVTEAMRRTKGNQMQAAHLSGMHRNTFHARVYAPRVREKQR